MRDKDVFYFKVRDFMQEHDATKEEKIFISQNLLLDALLDEYTGNVDIDKVLDQFKNIFQELQEGIESLNDKLRVVE